MEFKQEGLAGVYCVRLNHTIIFILMLFSFKTLRRYLLTHYPNSPLFCFTEPNKSGDLNLKPKYIGSSPMTAAENI